MWIITQKEQEKYLNEVKGFVGKNNKAFLCSRLYSSVIGMPPAIQALNFYAEIMKDTDIYNKIDAFLALDNLGHPSKMKMKDGKWASCNATRYLDSIRLLKKHFGSLDNMNIKEIGVGFGGLLHCIKTMWKPNAYHIVDFVEVLNFVRQNASCLNHTVQINNIVNNDLSIAEYSITEHTEDTLFELTDKHLMTANNIFVRCNILDNDLKTKWLNHLKTRFNITVEKELTDAVKMNCIVIGKLKV